MRTDSTFAMISPEADEEEFDVAEVDLTVSKESGTRAGAKKRGEYAARKAIEDYLERKRMREILDDELYQLLDE